MMIACMMQSVGFWVSPTLLQSMSCIDGLDGCDLMSLTILPNWKSLFDVRQDYQNLKSEDLPYST
jgi:hypothetical protein